MTTQAHDKLIYNGKRYSITEIEDPDSFFDINKLDLFPGMASTACYHGFRAIFECAYAGAKWVIEYLDDRRDMLTKFRKTEMDPSKSGSTCQDGTDVEVFKLPLNLILAHGLSEVVDCLQAAVELAASYQ